MIISNKNLLLTSLAFISGGLLTLAFAPYQLWPLAFLCLATLLVVWIKSNPKQAFWHGFSFGLGFFGFGIYWVFISIHIFGNTNAFLAGFLTVLFISFLALFYAVPGYLFRKIWQKDNWNSRLLAFPAIITLMEWVRTIFLTGLPWLLIGNSMVETPLRWWAPVVGVYGLTFIVTLIAASILYFNRLKKAAIPVTITIVFFASSYALKQIEWTHPINKSISVSLIQGNVEQKMKWDPEHLLNIMEKYQRLTSNHWSSDLIIWPESSLPIFSSQVKPFLDHMDQEALKNHSSIFLGIPIDKDDEYYNGMMVLGDAKGEYTKRHLVPFGEFLPMKSLLTGLINFFAIPMSDFSSGPEEQNLVQIKDLKISPFICYEIAYPDEVLTASIKSNFIVTITDDAWFGRSIAHSQHLQIAQMRSLETSRFSAFATNNGTTAIIRTDGSIQDQIPPFRTMVLTSTLTPVEGITPIMAWGIKYILILMGALMILSLIFVVKYD